LLRSGRSRRLGGCGGDASPSECSPAAPPGIGQVFVSSLRGLVFPMNTLVSALEKHERKRSSASESRDKEESLESGVTSSGTDAAFKGLESTGLSRRLESSGQIFSLASKDGSANGSSASRAKRLESDKSYGVGVDSTLRRVDGTLRRITRAQTKVKECIVGDNAVENLWLSRTK
jgi:hypothetical protein